MIDVNRGVDLYARARRRIPGGTQLLSKRPEMFLPEQWPSYFSRAAGVHVWDLDGRRYLDMSHNAIGANVLGAADAEVDAAVMEAIRSGIASTLNAPEELELADLLCELHPWAQMVRYARTGGEAMAVAVRIARARTRRDVIAFCGYHGWHDWYLAANLAEEQALDGHLLPGLSPVGVPRGLAGTALPFHYNRLDELEAIIAKQGAEIAAVVMEPLRDTPPSDGFLEGARRLAHDAGAVLVFDEITAGMRLTTGGAHLTLGVTPDIAVFAKAMSNGYPMAAIIGTEDAMQAAQDSFISSTYWTDRIGPVAALATLRKHRRENVSAHLHRIGLRVQTAWKDEGARAGLPIHVGGMTPLSHFHFDGQDAQAGHTAFTQLMLDRGILAGKGFYVTFAHLDEHVDEYVAAVRDVFGIVGDAMRSGRLPALLRGPVAHTGFARLT